MKHFRALCALLTAAMAASFAGPAGALTGVSSWAEPDVVAATSAGLTPDTFAALSAKSSVSRAEFCAVALKLYEAERETQVPARIRSILTTATIRMSTRPTRWT